MFIKDEKLGSMFSAEMYSVSVTDKKKRELEMKKKKNTFQQSTPSSTTNYVNVDTASPYRGASQPPSGEGVAEPVVGHSVSEVMYGRKLNIQNDLIVEMTCCIAKIRDGDRYSRANAYFSIKTETDKRFMIFLRSSLTSAHDEVLRSIDKSDNKPLRSIAETYIDEHRSTLLLGRLRYKPVNKFITEQHRKNLKHGLVALWCENGFFEGELYLNGEYYPLEFTQDLTEKQKKSGYQLMSHYEIDMGEID